MAVNQPDPAVVQDAAKQGVGKTDLGEKTLEGCSLPRRVNTPIPRVRHKLGCFDTPKLDDPVPNFHEFISLCPALAAV
jgi:hypothetical protein